MVWNSQVFAFSKEVANSSVFTSAVLSTVDWLPFRQAPFESRSAVIIARASSTAASFEFAFVKDRFEPILDWSIQMSAKWINFPSALKNKLMPLLS